MGPTTPILLFCFIVTAIGMMTNIIPNQLAKWGFTISSNNLEVDENLPDFFQALKMTDKEWFVTENDNSKQKYDFMVAN